MVKLSTLQPGQVAAEVWAYPTGIMPRRWADLAAVEALFFKKAETLGTDYSDSGGSVSHHQIGSNLPIYTVLTTGNVSGYRAGTHGQHGIARLDRLPAGIAPLTKILEVRALLFQVADCAVSIGFTSNTEREPTTPCAHFLYDSSVGANWQSRTYTTGEQQADTGVAGDTSAHIFRIESVSVQARFYIDGSLVCVHSTQVPPGGTQGWMDYISAYCYTLTTAYKTAYIFSVAVWME